MAQLPDFIQPDRADAAEVSHYRDLLRRSADARHRGDHWMAQQLASAAHKWAMQEMARLQHLAHEEEQLRQVAKRLQDAWDRDPACSSLDELQERHPEYRRLVTAVHAARLRVSELASPVPHDTSIDHAPRPRASR